MAQLQLKPPESFNFKTPNNWQKWKRRFEQFRSASGLVNQSEASQINTLLYCLGEEAEDVLTSTGISEDDRKKYPEVMGKFDTFFDVRTNVILERDSGKSKDIRAAKRSRERAETRTRWRQEG